MAPGCGEVALAHPLGLVPEVDMGLVGFEEGVPTVPHLCFVGIQEGGLPLRVVDLLDGSIEFSLAVVVAFELGQEVGDLPD